MRAAIIEDTPEIVTITATQLRELGYEVEAVCSNVGQALRIEDWSSVDVALVDLMLPEGGGDAVLDFLRHKAPHVRRIVMSAADERTVESARGKAHAVLLKPFDFKALQEALCG